MRKTFRILLFFSAVLWAGAEDLTCSVTQKGRLTTYSVSASKGTNCRYSWTNGTDHVIANEAEMPEYPVVSKDQTSLTTEKCFEEVHLTKDCTSDDTPQMISCNFVCKRNDTDGEKYNYLGASIAASVCVVVVTILIIIFICLRKKQQFKTVNLSDKEEQQGA